jgi:hypothetical protein
MVIILPILMYINSFWIQIRGDSDLGCPLQYQLTYKGISRKATSHNLNLFSRPKKEKIFFRITPPSPFIGIDMSAA